MKKILENLDKENIEYRMGSAGGGNQLRQPYLENFVKKKDIVNLKNTEHIHFYSFYIRKLSELDLKSIKKLLKYLIKLHYENFSHRWFRLYWIYFGS